MVEENVTSGGPSQFGAVDLSPAAQAPGPTGGGINVPLIAAVNEANFEEQMGLSQTVPVILLFISSASLASTQATREVENVVRSQAGAVALRTIDVSQEPSIAQALQIQNVPSAMALVARRPVPLFEGAPTKEQLVSLIDQLLQAAPQLGVTGRVAVSEEQLEKPVPDTHLAPRAAEDADNWEEAVQLWKKVLANDPGDKEAKVALSRAEFEARQQAEGQSESVLSRADSLFASGAEEQAFDLLLGEIADEADEADKEKARERLVQLLGLAVDKDAVKRARSRLTALLF